MSRDFWNKVPEPCQGKLQKLSRKTNFKAGDTVFLQGDPFRGPYVIEKGIFKIYQLNEAGKEAILNFFFPGSIIAALPILKNIPVYPASCEAVRDGSATFIPVHDCLSMMDDHPELKQCFQEDFVSNAEFFKDKTTLLMLHSTEERVVFFLEALGAAEGEVYLNIPKNQVALYLGVSPEAFSRAFTTLKKQGRVSESDGYVRLIPEVSGE